MFISVYLHSFPLSSHSESPVFLPHLGAQVLPRFPIVTATLPQNDGPASVAHLSHSKSTELSLSVVFSEKIYPAPKPNLGTPFKRCWNHSSADPFAGAPQVHAAVQSNSLTLLQFIFYHWLRSASSVRA
jgi:hypothetical protein